MTCKKTLLSSSVGEGAASPMQSHWFGIELRSHFFIGYKFPVIAVQCHVVGRAVTYYRIYGDCMEQLLIILTSRPPRPLLHITHVCCYNTPTLYASIYIVSMQSVFHNCMRAWRMYEIRISYNLFRRMQYTEIFNYNEMIYTYL